MMLDERAESTPGHSQEVDHMTAKERMLQTVKELPEDATVEDAMERLLLLAKVERGLVQADTGETVSHQAVMVRMAKWLK